MKKCPNCGAIVGDSQTKCNSCDRIIPADLEPVSAAPEIKTPENPIEEPAAFAEAPVAPAAPAEDLVEEPAVAAEEPAAAIEEPAVAAEEPSAAAADTSKTGTPVLELGDDTYVTPPSFPEDEAGKTSDIHLTLGDEDTPVVPPVYPEPPTDTPKQSAQGTVPPQGQSSSYQSTAQNTAGNTGGQTGGRVNLTQQAIHEEKQKQQYRQTSSSYNYTPAGDSSVTGTLGLILGIIGLVLGGVFGAIGSCGGVAGFSFILTIIGLVVSIIGLVISNRDRKLSGGTCSRAHTGFVLSLIGIVIGAVLLISGLSCVGCIGCMACTAAGAMVP